MISIVSKSIDIDVVWTLIRRLERMAHQEQVTWYKDGQWRRIWSERR